MGIIDHCPLLILILCFRCNLMNKHDQEIAEGKILTATSRNQGTNQGNINFYNWSEKYIRVGVITTNSGSYSELSPAMTMQEFEQWSNGCYDSYMGHPNKSRGYHYSDGYHIIENYLLNDPSNKLNRHKEEV